MSGVNAWSELIFADETPERIESRFSQVIAELGGAAPDHLAVSDTDPMSLVRLRPALDRLRDDESNPSLDDLAQLAGLTKYQLIRAVKRATGLAPLAWRQNARVTKARRMLRDGLPIADTAYALGFTDQSHFHRVFSAYVEASPGAYRS